MLTLEKLTLYIILLLVNPLNHLSAQEATNTERSWQRPRFEERKTERKEMVIDHIASHSNFPVRNEEVLEAMMNVPRHKFVPDEMKDLAYHNSPLPIGYMQTISQPFMVAHMTELLKINEGDKILEIGTGSGYQAAVLSELTPNIYTIEIVEELGMHAKKTLSELGYNTIKVKIGDGYEGWPSEAPFDRIIVTCAPENIPQPLIDQLRPGGYIVIPVGEAFSTQQLIVVSKDEKGRLQKQVQYPVRFVPMTGKVLEKEQ